MSSLFTASVAALALLAGVQAKDVYTLKPGDIYQGPGFYDLFEFFTEPDPTGTCDSFVL